MTTRRIGLGFRVEGPHSLQLHESIAGVDCGPAWQRLECGPQQEAEDPHAASQQGEGAAESPKP